MPANLRRPLPISPTVTMPAANVATSKVANQISVGDSSAIQRTLVGDINAFNRLVITYQGLAYSVAYRILHNRDAAEDAVQESFVKAFRSLGTFNGKSFKNWLTRIVINTCYDVLKAPQYRATIGLNDLLPEPEGELELYDHTESPDAYVQRDDLRQWIELGLRALPPDQRVVIVLSDIQGYSYEEIAEITDASMGTVKSRISRGRAKLREFLLQQPERLPIGLSL